MNSNINSEYIQFLCKVYEVSFEINEIGIRLRKYGHIDGKLYTVNIEVPIAEINRYNIKIEELFKQIDYKWERGKMEIKNGKDKIH